MVSILKSFLSPVVADCQMLSVCTYECILTASPFLRETWCPTKIKGLLTNVVSSAGSSHGKKEGFLES